MGSSSGIIFCLPYSAGIVWTPDPSALLQTSVRIYCKQTMTTLVPRPFLMGGVSRKGLGTKLDYDRGWLVVISKYRCFPKAGVSDTNLQA